MELLSAINGSSFYAKYAASAEKDVLGRTITSTYLTTVPTGTMNENELEFANNTITAYNGSAFAAGGGGDMLSANLEFDSNNNISGYNGSAFIANSANSAANSNKLNGQQAGYYCSDANAKIYSNFAGGNGITVAGELTQTKTINSNLTEYQLQEGVGITYDVDDTNETIKFHAKPEIFLYYTTAPIMASNTAIAFSTNSAAYNSKSGTVGINNSEITGLDSTKLYHCNVKMIVENVDSTPATVSVKATNWNNSESITYEYVNSSNSGTMELDWYIKGLTGCSLTGGGLSTAIQAGVKEIMITEVCYA